MNRIEKGSITIELLVMLGLIASLTPILYKQVYDRREDIENINQANTLLLLKTSTKEYIEANKENISIGTMTLNPIDIGIDISGYSIGIQKKSDGSINAMIVATDSGTDLKAAKIASLLGVSAGVYSAQDTSKVWGINGIWAENISSYGFTSLATGVPVVTTIYDKESSSTLNEEQLKEFIENTTFEQFTAKQFCIDNPDISEDRKCLKDWNDINHPINIILNCNAGIQSACKKGWNNNLNRSCEEISLAYQNVHSEAPSKIYKLTTSDNTQVEKACYFVSGNLPSNTQLIEGAKTSDIARRYDWENHKLSTSCENILANWNSAPSSFYSFITGINTYEADQPCYFVSARMATAEESIIQCNTANSSIEIKKEVACRYGYIKDYNTSCDILISNYPSGISKINSITTYDGGHKEYCPPCPSDGSCLSINGERWVRSTTRKGKAEAEQFCSDKGMTVSSSAQLQVAGMLGEGSTDPFNSTNPYNDRVFVSDFYADDYVCAAVLGTDFWNCYWDDDYTFYTLCSPK